MAIDRGGLNYTISVTDAFSKATEKFRSEMDLARQSFAQFKAESQGLAAANTNITVSMNQATAASQRKTRQLSAEEEAERKLTRVLKDRIVEERLREIALEKGVDLSQKKVRSLSVEQEAERKLLASARSAAVARKAEELAIQRGVDLSRKKIAALTVEQEAQAKVEAAVRRRAVSERANELAQQAGLDFSKKKAKALSLEEEALARVTAMEKERALAARVQQIQQERFIGPTLPPSGKVPNPGSPEVVSGLQKAQQQLQAFRDKLGLTNQTGNDLTFTFRRLFGVLALFQAARAIFSAFTDFIKAGVQFNATIESTKNGIAALLVTIGQVRDAQGQVVEGADGFLLAQKEAVRQQKLLRAEGLKTTATFEELLNTFQVALGPGLSAGLKVDEIRKFSVQVAQAASTLGVAQNQLSEEIRSTLTGTGTDRTTRLRIIISPEEIKRAREAGTLFQTLQERFASFGKAGEENAKTFEGLKSILTGAIDQLAGAAALPFFDEIKATMQQIIDLILKVGPDGSVIINPDAIRAVAPIFQGILKSIEAIKAAVSQLGFRDLATTTKLIGASIAIAGQVIGGVLQGLSAGFQVVFSIIDKIAPLFVGQGKSLTEIVALVTKFATIFGFISAAVGLTSFAISAILSPLKQALSLVSSLATAVIKVVGWIKQIPIAVLKSVGSALLLVGIFIFIADKVRDVVSAIFGVQVSLKDTIELIALGFVGGILDAISFVEILAFRIKNSISEAFTSAAEAAVNFITKSQALLAAFLGNNQELQLLEDQLFQQELQQDQERQKRRIGYERDLADMRAQSEAKSKAFTDSIAGVVGDAAGKFAANKSQGTLEEIFGAITDQVSGIFGKLTGLFGGLNKDGGFSLDKILDLEGFQKKLDEALKGTDSKPVTVTPRGKPVSDEERRALVDAQAKLAVLQDQLAAQTQLNALQAAGRSESEIRLQELQNQLSAMKTQLETSRAANALDLEKAQNAIGGAVGEEQKANFQQQFLTLQQQQVTQEALLTAQIQNTNIELKKQQDIVSGTIGSGFDQGLQDFSNKFSSAFQAGIEISTGLLQSFTSFAADSIVAAFDPNNDQTIKERFGHFLQDIAKLIIQQLIQLQIAKLILGFGGGTPAGFIGPPAPGFAEGGSIPRHGGRPSLAHFQARGYATGGGIRPANLDRRDTVPIWAQPGEFMQNLSAVRTYGRDFMEALNNRVLDPGALRSLAGLHATRSLAVRSRRGPGFVSGGLISDQIARSAASQAFQAGSPSATGGAQRAVVVAGEGAFDKLIAGGSNAMLRFMRENKDTVRGILDRG